MSDERKLQEALEHKAEMLLSAQGHYLRAIRMGDDRWAVASGYRVGELYDAFRQQLLDAALPPGLDGEAARAYRDELRGGCGSWPPRPSAPTRQRSGAPPAPASTT